MINGVDEISLSILKDFEDGKTIPYIIDRYNISLDQAKKLSRLKLMYDQLSFLSEILQIKLKRLGIKALVLAPLVKENDMEGIEEILQSVDEDVKRDTLAKMILALKEKRSHINSAKKEMDSRLRTLEATEDQLEVRINRLNETKIKIDEVFSFLNGSSRAAKEFLVEHLGVKNEKIVLSKRLYYKWQQELKHKGIIKFDDEAYIWLIEDIDKLIEATEKKLLNNRSSKLMRFDPVTDPWNSSPEYKKIDGLSTSLKDQLMENELEIIKLCDEKKAILRSIDTIKLKSVTSYMESAVLSNMMSARDIETHALLQNSGMKWLYERNNVCCTEFTRGNYRFDVIGYDDNNNVTIIEAKASIEDFKRDEKWHKYLMYCNRFYFIFREEEFCYLNDSQLDIIKTNGAGIIVVKKNKTEIFYEAMNLDIEDPIDNLAFSISRICSKKMIYGY